MFNWTNFILTAGDYVKFGFPLAYAMTLLSWGGVAYAKAYSVTGQVKS